MKGGDEKTVITLRPLHCGDIESAMALSLAEGWNQTAGDWEFLVEGSQNSCAAALCGEQLVGTTIAIGYANLVAWIGMVLVHQSFRGKGISKLLLEHIFRQTVSYPSVKLDATTQGQRVYEKFGFTQEYRIARMELVSKKNMPSGIEQVLLLQAQRSDLPEIIALDERVFGTNRAGLMAWLVNQYPGKAWTIKQDNRVRAFVLGRAGSRFHHIGPVVAENDGDAVSLVIQALQGVMNEAVIVDVPCNNKGFVAALAHMGFNTKRYFTRMYRYENPYPGTSNSYYAICGPEFG